MLLSSIFVILIGIISVGGITAVSIYLIFQPKLELDISIISAIEENPETARITGIVLAVISFLSLVLFLLSLNSIKVSAKINKKMIKAIVYMPGYILTCFVFMTASLVWIWVWALLSFQIFGDLNSFMDGKTQIEYKYYFYHFLFGYWNLQILSYMLYTIIGASSCELMLTGQRNFYTTSLGLIPCIVWFARCILQIGTILFGSLILAVLNTMQTIMNIIRRQVAKKETVIEKIFFYLANTIFCCLRFIADWLSQKGLLYALMFNTDFLTGMVEGNGIIISNIGDLLYPLLMKGVVLGILQFGVPFFVSFAIDFIGTQINLLDRLSGTFLLYLVMFNFLVTRCIVLIFSAAIEGAFMAYGIRKHYNLEKTNDMTRMIKLEAKYKEQSNLLNKGIVYEVSK